MKHFLLAMATLWCVASTFSSFAADNNKWKPLFGKNLENANYNPEVWSETDGVLGAVKDESIWTKDEYENFELDLDFKTDVGTNSGVVVSTFIFPACWPGYMDCAANVPAIPRHKAKIIVL